MDTNRIKKFATEARNILKRGIAAKITTLGFDIRGNVPESQMPQLMQGGTLWNGQLETESFYHQWMSLYHKVQTKGISEVYEEAAYTWFNRLMAIRILQKNGLCEPVMEYADASRTPRIVNEARMGNLPQMPEEVRRRLVDLLDDDTKVTEQFAVLVTAWCHQNPIIQNCFGGIKDYTELLLPRDILSEGGFVDMINHSEFITDEDYTSAELIGWLYQFYISERKDEVFAKKSKFEADEIPAATQIFTPNWIVKYMVQNTVGRIYLDNNPYAEDEFKPQWKYLVDSTEPTPERAIFHYDELTDLKVADLACGSGHILNECFDLLYDLYISEAYSRSEAIENIFKCNLTGIDLDNRAKQMTQFALLIKACQKDNRFADAHCMPNVLTMPEKRDKNTVTSVADLIHHITLGAETPQMIEEIESCYELMQDANSLGSIMKFHIGETTRLMLKQTVEHWNQQTVIPTIVEEEMPRLNLILALTERYSTLVMNPPYMGRGGMNDILTRYVHQFYSIGKWDLFAVFMLMGMNSLLPNGKLAMINMHSWMFLDSFLDLRKFFISKYHIDNMLHLGPNTFDELSGEVVQNTSFVVTNNIFDQEATYYRLSSGKSCGEKEQLFANNSCKFTNIHQKQFLVIPSSPIAYWLSSRWFNLFKAESVDDYAYSKAGIVSGNDDFFVRLWFEVSLNDICFKKQAPYAKFHCFQKGGTNRLFYGNNEYVFKLKDFWSEDFYNKSMRRGDENSYFAIGIGWSYTGSTENKAFRLIKNCVCGTATPSIYMKDDQNLLYTLGFLNSKVTSYILPILNPTLSLPPGYLIKIPFIDSPYLKNDINKLVGLNVNTSQKDWDAHETSWDFKTLELLSIDYDTYIDNINYQIEEHYRKTGEHICIDPATPEFDNIEWCYNQYCQKWERLFRQIHANQEELNRLFINIYGLQDELSPDVPLKEITIMQQGEITITDDNEIHFNGNVLMKQLISYAVGIWMGRYRFDKPGLHIAHPEPLAEELAPYSYHDATVYIDDDSIIPILPSGCPFDDNLASRVADFIRIAFGEERLTENLNFMEKQLGMTIEQYLMKEFWKDHTKMYQNRPIYWLFSSKKGAFKCLTYMHRMTPYTAERVRAKYLLPYIEKLNQQVNDFMNRAASLSTAERRQMDNLKKILDECNEYHDRLQVLAEDTERTSFDLDDGVVLNYAKYGDVLAKLK